MILLDNEVYITNACNLLSKAPGYRVIPLGISCLTGGDFQATSVLNFLSTLIILYLMFTVFSFSKVQKIVGTIIFGLNSFIAFPYFYAAAHSYVYTILISVISLYVIHRYQKITYKNFFILILCGLLLKLVRSEGPIYFIISFIAYSINRFMESKDLKDFWIKNKQKLILFSVIIGATLLFNIILKVSISHGEKITKNLADGKYVAQFPRETFFAVSIWATLDYLRAFLTPHYMNFYGNYNDWFSIHKSFNLRILLYSFLGGVSLLSTVFIFKRKKTFFCYMIIGLSIFLIPGFLISSFLRNQWYFPSRALLGCILALPFFVQAFLKIKKEKLRTLIVWSFAIINTFTFLIHDTFHFKDEETMYTYETKFIGNKHPTLNKVYAQKLFLKKDFLKATKVLRESGRLMPEDGIFLSANTFFLWAENLYWSAASSFYYKSPITEEMLLKKLYKNPNFFSAIACLQDKRVPIEYCSHQKFLQYLCHPIYKKKFGYKYYKNPRIKAELICSKYKRN